MLQTTVCFVTTSLLTTAAFGQVPAFPGALGFGANATGGRFGSVYHVTTLADSGPGSFRDAVSQPNRIVVFDVGGYIPLASEVSVKDNITIAGQTAPGGGIGIMGREVSFGSSENIICRHVRFRPGSGAPDGDNGVNLYQATNVILDHVSIEFAPWNNIDAVNCDRITVQNSLIADPIYQQFGAHTEHLSSYFSWFYTLFANAHNRQPLAKINTIFINNAVYNYQAAYTVANTSGSFSHDIVNNYFITGPATTSAGNDFYQMNSGQSIYASGNLRDSDKDGTLNGSATAPGGVTVLTSPWSPLTAGVPTFSTASAFRYDVSTAGALPRDPVDDLVASQVKTLGKGTVGTGAGTAGPSGGLYSSQTQTGLPNNGFGNIPGGATPLDSDQDGMPDYWEISTGSNPNVNDSMAIAPDGYALIEHYLNWLAEPHALTPTNTAVDVELWNLTSGFTNATPAYAVANGSNGVVTLLANGHTAHFTPDTDFSGLGSFQFSVVASDGSACTNTVNVLVSSQPQPADLIWVGDGTANNWGVGVGTNWLDDGVPAAFASGDNVMFDDSGSSLPAVNLIGSLSAGEVLVSASQDYTFGGSGSLVGPSSLVKEGSGKLTINTLNTFTGGTTINDGIVQLGDGVTANGSLNGNITNFANLVFANPTAVSAGANISGNGTFTKEGAGTLTLSGAQTYTGLTTINAGVLEIAGAPAVGLIQNNAALSLKLSSSLTYPGVITGPGSVAVNASGQTLTLTGANSYAGGTTVNGGTLLLANRTAAGTGTVIYYSGSVEVGNGVTVSNDFSIPSATTDLSMSCTSGTGTWAGNVVNLGGGASWRPGSDGGTLIFTGTALQGSRNFIVPRGTFHMAGNAVISATGSATALGRDSGGNNRSANIFIEDNAVVTLGPCSMGGAKAGGSITVTIRDNAMLSTGANNFDLHNVTRSSAINTLRLNGGTMIVGGFTKTRTYANIINFNGTLLRAGADNASFLPAFSAQTAVVQAGGARIDDGGFVITISQPLSHDAALGATPDGGLTKLGSGTLTLVGPGSFTGPTIVAAGTLALSGGGSIPGSTMLDVAAGAEFQANLAAGSFLLNNGGVLKGAGSLQGNIVIGNGATLEPGDSVGTLTFKSNLILDGASTLDFELGTNSDRVVVAGNLVLAGTLNVAEVGGLAPGSYTLFSYGGILTPGTVTIGSVPGGYTYWIDNATPGQVNLVVGVPEIESARLRPEGLVLTGSGGSANGLFYVLNATNLALPLDQWAYLSTNQFGPTGQFTVTNTFDDAIPQSYFRISVR